MGPFVEFVDGKLEWGYRYSDGEECGVSEEDRKLIARSMSALTDRIGGRCYERAREIAEGMSLEGKEVFLLFLERLEEACKGELTRRSHWRRKKDQDSTLTS